METGWESYNETSTRLMSVKDEESGEEYISGVLRTGQAKSLAQSENRNKHHPFLV